MEKSQIGQLAQFAQGVKYEDVPAPMIDQLKRHLLDSLGAFIHAIRRPTIQKLFRHIQTTAGVVLARSP